MEPLAYLHLAQVYESSETEELVFLRNLSGSIALLSLTRFDRSGKTTVSLVSAASTAWMLVAPTIALTTSILATDLLATEALAAESVSKEFVPVIVGEKYVHSYAGGSYYYIFQDSEFEERPAYAVTESSYHPVRPELAPNQPLCGVFKLGDSGSGVVCLQELLQKAGYFDGAITGYFGTITCDAVMAFQHEHGLYVDGVVGPQTLAVLNQITGSV